MRRIPLFFVLLLGGMLMMGADGCSSDPNVEGAKLDLRNKDYDRALENVNTAIANDPQNAEAFYLKGQILQAQAQDSNDPEARATLSADILEAYTQAVELDPELGEDVQQRLRLAYFNEFQSGIQAFNRGQDDAAEYDVAATYFNNAAIIMPDSASAYLNRAYALLNAGDQTAAIEPFEKVLELDAADQETYIYLADLYRMAERQDDYVTTLEAARQAFPQNEDIQAQLLNAYIVTDQVDRAMDVYSQAVEREPNNKLYRYNYGSLLLEAGEYDAAIAQLERAIELDPEYGNAQYNLGAAYINMAVDLIEQINAKDDELREQRGDLERAEIERREAEIDEMNEQRRTIFMDAIGPLERAKTLTDASGEDNQGICRALFQAYVQTNQRDKAESVSACAGYEDMN